MIQLSQRKGAFVVPPLQSDILHATSIAINGHGLLLLGPSGLGKSDLALRCLAMGPSPLYEAPFELISDDRTLVSVCNRQVIMTAPSAIAGQLEVRGVGIVDVPHTRGAELCLVARLTDEDVERYPALEPRFECILGRSFPMIHVRAFEASAPVKLAIALKEFKVPVAD